MATKEMVSVRALGGLRLLGRNRIFTIADSGLWKTAALEGHWINAPAFIFRAVDAVQSMSKGDVHLLEASVRQFIPQYGRKAVLIESREAP
jgi:hypothetical protein